MALTKRGKIVIGSIVAAAVVGVSILAFTGNAPGVIQDIVDSAIGRPSPCPLTGEVPHGGRQAPDRPVLAVKIENSPESRPQAGLDDADIVYEEPVEGGLTRFIVLFQCRDSKRVGPVRSARTTDPRILVQFGSPLLAYAGGVQRVESAVARAGLVDLSAFGPAAGAYARDDTREAPHNLYTKTRALYRQARSTEGPPDPVFRFDPDLPGAARRALRIQMVFSSTYADVNWRWSDKRGGWLRSHGSDPHVLEDGRQVIATNVVVMHVQMHDSTILDAAGNPSPDIDLTGHGKAWVFRNGRVIVGRWERAALSDLTRFVTRDGDEIALAPGVTWVELLPTQVPVEIG